MTRPLLVTLVALLGCSRPTSPGSTSKPAETAKQPAKPSFLIVHTAQPAEQAEPSLVTKPKPPPAKRGERLVEREFAESRKFEGSDADARYRFEGDQFTTDLELHAIRTDQGTLVELRHPDTAGLRDRAPALCETEFQHGDSLVSQVLDHGVVSDGRRMLEVWVSCRSGEDIVTVESEVWLVLDDGEKLERFWSGSADYRGSWACAVYDQLDFVLHPDEVVLTRSEVGEIYERGVEAYDCANARDYVEPRGTERIPLPHMH